MSRHNRHIEELFKIATDVAPVAAARIAAKLVIGNRVISYGINSYKTDPFQVRFGKNKDSVCKHAEISAIKNALKNVDIDELNRATLYIARAKKNGKDFVYGLANPCSGCMRAINNYGIKKVFFTCDDGSFYSINKEK